MESKSINRRRLFIGSCWALIATSVAFVTVGAIMLSLKGEFTLTNQQVGWIGGAALWGFAVSQLLFSPFCDILGMKFLLRLAFIFHLAGAIVMLIATGFWGLFAGAALISFANGLVEAACNPLVATLYPEEKTVKLNQFHVWFPGGIVLGGLAAYALNQVGLGAWQVQLALVFIPTLIYGYLFFGQEFPQTENVQSGVSLGGMFKATFSSPLMWLMLFAMALTASVELGPNRWVPAVMEAGAIPGILVLVWINGLMAVMRYKAGPVVHRLSSTGILLASAIISAIGLYWLSYATTGVVAFCAATVFAIGVCYFWPTMLGFVAERIPKSGALGLGLMGAVGMATVGGITAPQMGKIADEYSHRQFDVTETISFFERAAEALPASISEAPDALKEDLRSALNSVQGILGAHNVTGQLPSPETANALRQVIGSGAAESIVGEAQSILSPADNYGGRISFRYVVPLCAILAGIFLMLFLGDKRRKGEG